MKINCPVVNCDYVTEDVDPSVAAALLQLHNNSHNNASFSINVRLIFSKYKHDYNFNEICLIKFI